MKLWVMCHLLFVLEVTQWLKLQVRRHLRDLQVFTLCLCCMLLHLSDNLITSAHLMHMMCLMYCPNILCDGIIYSYSPQKCQEPNRMGWLSFVWFLAFLCDLCELGFILIRWLSEFMCCLSVHGMYQVSSFLTIGAYLFVKSFSIYFIMNSIIISLPPSVWASSVSFYMFNNEHHQ